MRVLPRLAHRRMAHRLLHDGWRTLLHRTVGRFVPQTGSSEVNHPGPLAEVFPRPRMWVKGLPFGLGKARLNVDTILASRYSSNTVMIPSLRSTFRSLRVFGVFAATLSVRLSGSTRSQSR